MDACAIDLGRGVCSCVFLQWWRGSYSLGSLEWSFICCEVAHREEFRRECSNQVSAVDDDDYCFFGACMTIMCALF